MANPKSGTQKLEHVLNGLVEILDATDEVDYEVFLTTRRRDARKIVSEQLDTSYTDLLVIGGDGTINQAINGLDHDIPVSFIPNGSGNDFCKNISIGQTLEEQVDVLLSGRVHTIDLGLCNDRKFINGVGIGFDGQIVADMEKGRQWLRGQAKYYYHVMRILATYRSRRFFFTQDKTRYDKNLILLCIANGTTFGGAFKLTPEAQIDDSILDVCEIGSISGIKRFMNIHRLEHGTHDQLSEVKLSRCMYMRIEENDKLHAHIDGEYMGQPPFEIRVLPNALKIRLKP